MIYICTAWYQDDQGDPSTVLMLIAAMAGKRPGQQVHAAINPRSHNGKAVPNAPLVAMPVDSRKFCLYLKHNACASC